MAARQATPDCLRPETVAQLIAGQLPAAENERAHVHLEVCADCTRRVAEAVGADPEARWPMRALSPGTQVGRFVVREFVGEGPGGTLFEAEDGERRVLLKFQRPDRNPEFVREEQGLARVSHPNLVNVLGAGEHQGERWVALEKIDGESLDEWLARPRAWRETLELFLGAARGLAAAHAAGIVHRDFKPENVIVDRDGHARVGNFGLAQATPSPSQVMRTVKGELAASSTAGTPAYMAPEQFRGRSGDPRSDQFAFGVALYRALYGQQPFDPQWAAEQQTGRRTPLGSVHFSLLVKSLDRTTLINFAKEVIGGNVRPAPAGTEVPGWLEGVVWRGLRSDPEDRYDSMDALLADVEESLGGRPAAGARVTRRSGVTRAALVAGGAGVLLLLGLLFRSRKK